jgi:hypothetical protein
MRKQQLSLRPASVGFLLGLHTDPEDGGDMFLRNVEGRDRVCTIVNNDTRNRTKNSHTDRKNSQLIVYKHYVSGHYPSSCFCLKTLLFGDWILSPSSGGIYSVGPNP